MRKICKEYSICQKVKPQYYHPDNFQLIKATEPFESCNILTTEWERVLPNALHAIRLLLCTDTNCTTHAYIFNFHRHSTTGKSMLSWLMHPGKVLMHRNARKSMYDPLVDEVDLLEGDSQYAHLN